MVWEAGGAVATGTGVTSFLSDPGWFLTVQLHRCSPWSVGYSPDQMSVFPFPRWSQVIGGTGLGCGNAGMSSEWGVCSISSRVLQL